MGFPDGYNCDLPIGEDNANNAFDTSNVSSNKDGSVLERLEEVQEKMAICVVAPLVAGDLTGTVTRFTVSGLVEIESMGMLVTTAIPAGANTLKFSFTPTGGGATDLSGATDTASAAANQIFLVNGVKATGLVKATDAGISVLADSNMPIKLSSGAIRTIFSAGAPATGGASLFIRYRPLVPFAKIV